MTSKLKAFGDFRSLGVSLSDAVFTHHTKRGTLRGLIALPVGMTEAQLKVSRLAPAVYWCELRWGNRGRDSVLECSVLCRFPSAIVNSQGVFSSHTKLKAGQSPALQDANAS